MLLLPLPLWPTGRDHHLLIWVLVLLRHIFIVTLVRPHRALQHKVTNHRIGFLESELTDAFIFDLFAEEWLYRWLVNIERMERERVILAK